MFALQLGKVDLLCYFLRFADNWNMDTQVVALKFIGKGSLFLPEKETPFIRS